jgi:hypothetical protein
MKWRDGGVRVDVPNVIVALSNGGHDMPIQVGHVEPSRNNPMPFLHVTIKLVASPMKQRGIAANRRGMQWLRLLRHSSAG